MATFSVDDPSKSTWQQAWDYFNQYVGSSSDAFTADERKQYAGYITEQVWVADYNMDTKEWERSRLWDGDVLSAIQERQENFGFAQIDSSPQTGQTQMTFIAGNKDMASVTHTFSIDYTSYFNDMISNANKAVDQRIADAESNLMSKANTLLQKGAEVKIGQSPTSMSGSGMFGGELLEGRTYRGFEITEGQDTRRI